MYGKLFQQMYEGTLASRGPWEALVTFQQLIILANKHGEVDMTAEVISRRTTIPLEIIKKGLEVLAQPDPDSRTPTDSGRRIRLLEGHRDWGWKIVNYEHYRSLRNEDERREYQRNLMARRREAERKRKSRASKGPDVTKAGPSVTSANQNGLDFTSTDKSAGCNQEMLAPVSNVSLCSKQYAVSRSRSIKSKSYSRAISWPEGFGMTEDLAKFATEKGLMLEQIAEEFAAFRDYHVSKGSVFKDWSAAWRTWVRNSVKFRRKSNGNGQKLTGVELARHNAKVLGFTN